MQVRMIGLKSANDCPERDPTKFVVSVIYKGSKSFEQVYEEEDNDFTSRYQHLDFPIFVERPITTLRVTFKENRSMKLYKHWGTGTQLSELVLYK